MINKVMRRNPKKVFIFKENNPQIHIFGERPESRKMIGPFLIF